jgi:thiamine biosynthesis lipoprotein ApbE
MQITLAGRSRFDRAGFEAAEAAALASIDWHNARLSAWKPDSEFSRWLATQDVPVPVSPELFQVLALFDHWRQQTGGALDPSAETAARLWQRATSEGRRPSEAETAQAVAAMQQQHWRLDTMQGIARRTSDAPVALASLAKSYIASRAADAALAAGATGAMLNIGGDIVVRGDLHQVVRIADPLADSENDAPFEHVLVRDRAVATSGSYRRGFAVSGSRPEFSHILDPRTAQPTGHILSSTVIAQDASTAGALATAFSVMQPEESGALAARLPGVDYLLITREGERIASAGWQQYRVPALQRAAYTVPHATTAQAKKRAPAPPAKPTTWDPAYDLSIEVELAQPQQSRSRRPYVAVWIENEDHFPVRTLALWYDKGRYLPELTEWYRDELNRKALVSTDITSTVASATRSPGKYTLKWDGKDDEGKLVPAGKYTVCIEAAREHGGTEMLRHAIETTPTPQEFAFPAGAELGPVSLDYRKQ